MSDKSAKIRSKKELNKAYTELYRIVVWTHKDGDEDYTAIVDHVKFHVSYIKCDQYTVSTNNWSLSDFCLKNNIIFNDNSCIMTSDDIRVYLHHVFHLYSTFQL